MTRKLWYFSFFLVSLFAAGCSTTPSVVPPPPGEPPAEETLPSPSPPPHLAGLGGENIYHIGSGDVLKITIYGEPDISGLFRVSREGKISWSWVGEVEVGGLSEAEVARKLKETLTRDYIRRPRAEVTVQEYHSQVVYLFGNIRAPGLSRLGDNRSLLTNLLQNGGPKVWGEGAIVILRADQKTGKQERITVGLPALLRGERDILLENGDIVTVSAPEPGEAIVSENRIYVVGAVNKPGSFPWRDNMTALDALMKAGGLAEYASGNSARLVRGQGEEKKEYRIEFKEILDGAREKNINLLPGDLIIIPESWL